MKKIKREKKEKVVVAPKSFQYGTKEISILNQKNDRIPKAAFEVELTDEDKDAIAIGIKNNLPILLVGEAGTGKTSIGRYIAHKRGQGYVRISMTGYATPDELIGSKSVKGGATYHEDGILTKAMREGHLVVLDEVNATPPDCLFILHGLLDDDRRISLPNGDIVVPHKDFRFIATMNPDYEGTKSLNRAFLDRFSVILTIQNLLETKEVKLLIKRSGIVEELAQGIVATAMLARKNFKEQKTVTWVSTRTLLQWADLLRDGVANKKAYTVSVANKASEEERQAFMDFFSLVFKESVTGIFNSTDAFISTRKEVDSYKHEASKALLLVSEKEKCLVELSIKYQVLVDELKKAGVDKLAKKIEELEKMVTSRVRLKVSEDKLELKV